VEGNNEVTKINWATRMREGLTCEGIKLRGRSKSDVTIFRKAKKQSLSFTYYYRLVANPCDARTTIENNI
jgi:hypothetical protein